MPVLDRSLYDEDHQTFRESVRRFVAGHVAPHLDTWRAERRFPRGMFAALGEHGFLGTAVPEELGGGGVDDPLFTAVLVEELAAVGAAGLALAVGHHAGVALPAVLRMPMSPDRDAWVTGMGNGHLLAVPLCPRVGTEARVVPAAGEADLFLVVREDEVRVIPRDLVALAPVPLLGGAEVGAAEVVLAEDSQYAAAGDDAVSVVRDLDLWSAVVSASSAAAAIALTIDYVRERRVFGRPIAEFENTRLRLAELGADLAAARQLVDRCLVDLAEGVLTPSAAAAARIVAGRTHDALVDQGMQLHGGYGYMREYPISHAFGDARFLRVVETSLNEPRQELAHALGL